MTNSDYLALAGLGISAFMFLHLANRTRTRASSIDGYFLSSHDATGNEYGGSMVAASTSLATVLIFFIASNSRYGISMVYCGLTYLLGQWLFLKLLKHVPIETKDMTSNSDFWYNEAGGKWVARVITGLTFISFLIILFVELYVGSVIVTYYLKTIPYADAIAFFALGLFVIWYSHAGGLPGVLSTDVWQGKLIVVSVLALAVFAVGVSSKTAQSVDWHSFFTFEANSIELVMFLGWILLVNITLPFTQLSNWQRIAAVISKDEAIKGFRQNIWSFLAIWILPVLALAYLKAKGLEFSTLDGLFDSLKASGGWVDGILYPLIVVGFAAALFSTADTAFLAIQLSIADSVTLGPRLRKSEEKLKSQTLSASISVVLILAVIFFIARANVGQWFMPLIYTTFGILTVVSPQLLYILLKKVKHQPISQITGVGDWAVVSGIVLGVVVTFGMTILSVNKSNPVWSQLGTLVGIILSGLGLAAGIALSKTANK